MKRVTRGAAFAPVAFEADGMLLWFWLYGTASVFDESNFPAPVQGDQIEGVVGSDAPEPILRETR